MRAMSRPRLVTITAATLVSVLLPLDAWAALPRKDAGYQGSSSQRAGGKLNYPVAMRVSKSGATLSRFDIQWVAKCAAPEGQRSIGGVAVIQKRRISRKGSFGSTASYSRDVGSGQTADYKIKLAGKFKKRTLATGTFRATVSIKDAAGQQVDSCDSRTFTWKARD